MDNLTRGLRIAFEAPDFRPLPGHDLVIFKRVGAGLRFRRLVPAGQLFRPGLLESGVTLVAFAVSRDPNWTHKFFKRLVHVKQIYQFTLNCSVSFHVRDAQQLVELLERDPLLRIENEAVEIFGGTVAHLDWTVISGEEEQMSRTALLQEGPDRHGVMRSNLERFELFAAEYGIAVDRVVLTRSLPTEHLKVPAAQKSADEARQIGWIRHPLQVEDKLREAQLRSMDREQTFIDTGLEAAIATLRRVAGNVGSFEEMAGAVDRLVEIRGKVQLALGGGGATAALLAPGASPLLPAGASQAPRLPDLLQGLARLLSGLPPEPAVRALACAALHLLAELFADGESDLGRIEAQRSALHQGFTAVLESHRLEPADNQLLRHLQDIEAVRRELC
jgi:hypothetical protein